MYLHYRMASEANLVSCGKNRARLLRMSSVFDIKKPSWLLRL